MIIKFDEYTLIKESPDHIDDRFNGKRLDVEDTDAIAFFVDTNEKHTKVEKLYVTEFGQFHSYIGPYHSYPGRLWKNSKVITFWVYPNPVLFKNIIKKLETQLSIKIFNNEWKVEVVRNKKGDITTRDVDAGEYTFSDVQYYHSDFIPIEDYYGSEDFDDEDKLMHLMNWEEKERLKKSGKLPKGFGSDKTAFDQPKNIKWRQAMYQENKNI
jgi:hypothetical protein